MKPMLIAECGGDSSPGQPEPWSDPQSDVTSKTPTTCDQGTDRTGRGDVEVTPMSSLTKDLKAEWWIEYLERQRDSQFGVPRIFLGEPGREQSYCRCRTAGVHTRLRMRQKHRSASMRRSFPINPTRRIPRALIIPDKIRR